MSKLIRVRADLLALAYGFVSREEARYYLNGVNIHAHADGGAILVATDGHRLAAFYDESAYLGTVPNPGELIITLPAPFLKECANKREDRWAFIDLEKKQAALGKLCATDWPTGADCVALAPNVLIDGTFPDWRRIIPPMPDAETRFPPEIGFNPKLIGTFDKVTNGGALQLYATQGSGAPVLLRAPACPEFFGLIMPMRRPSAEDGYSSDFPAWIQNRASDPEPEQQQAAE
jgi:hypothetical protein